MTERGRPPAARARPPTDEPTEVYDQTPLPRPRTATKKGAGIELATPTTVAPMREQSEPIRVISMKGAGVRPEEPREAKQHKVQLRSLEELGRRHATPPGGLGNFAPPRDPREARTRRWRDYVIWGSVAVILGCAVMIGIWFLGRT